MKTQARAKKALTAAQIADEIEELAKQLQTIADDLRGTS